jgi:phosphatidylglycerol:prolipoprotein diacylglycerol transferase
MYYTHNVDPVLLQLGSLEIRWYGVFYLVSFLVGYKFLFERHKRGFCQMNSLQIQDLITYLMVGMMVGARVVYAVIYNWDYYGDHIIEIFYIWKGGLSFHGAIMGFAGGIYLFGKKYKIPFWHISDNVVMVGALGVFIGRWGNWTNGELWGRVTDVPWAVIFPAAGPQPRHPSQIYQSLAEGLCVFLILLWLDHRERKKHVSITEAKKSKLKVTWNRTGIVTGSFLIAYGVARFIVEFFRQPDAQLGFYFKYFSMGQILCFLMIIIGWGMLLYNKRYITTAEYQVEAKS